MCIFKFTVQIYVTWLQETGSLHIRFSLTGATELEDKMFDFQIFCLSLQPQNKKPPTAFWCNGFFGRSPGGFSKK
jgi:hypothetical protein